MAGAGFKTFASGEVLTAANVNTYLMQQTVMVFADSSARSTALGANVSEGMLSYLKDTNKVEVYDGSSWVASDDPNAIQNTIVDAKADLITATAADTPARLAVGTNGQVLTANSSTSTGLEWTTISAGGMTELASTTLNNSASTYTYSSLGSYKHILIIGQGLQSATAATDNVRMRFNGDTGSNYYWASIGNNSGSFNGVGENAESRIQIAPAALAETGDGSGLFGNFQAWVLDYTASGRKSAQGISGSYAGGGSRAFAAYGQWNNTNAITSITLFTSSGANFKAGIIKLYGVS